MRRPPAATKCSIKQEGPENMSAAYYYRCLSYRKGHGGVAKEGDLMLQLHSAPPVFPEAVEISLGEVQRGTPAFIPYVREREGEAKRDMSAPEVIAVRMWLSGILDAVMRVALRAPEQTERRR